MLARLEANFEVVLLQVKYHSLQTLGSGHEGFAVDNFKWFLVTLDGNFEIIGVLVTFLCSKTMANSSFSIWA